MEFKIHIYLILTGRVFNQMVLLLKTQYSTIRQEAQRLQNSCRKILELSANTAAIKNILRHIVDLRGSPQSIWNFHFPRICSDLYMVISHVFPTPFLPLLAFVHKLISGCCSLKKLLAINPIYWVNSLYISQCKSSLNSWSLNLPLVTRTLLFVRKKAEPVPFSLRACMCVEKVTSCLQCYWELLLACFDSLC